MARAAFSVGLPASAGTSAVQRVAATALSTCAPHRAAVHAALARRQADRDQQRRWLTTGAFFGVVRTLRGRRAGSPHARSVTISLTVSASAAADAGPSKLWNVRVLEEFMREIGGVEPPARLRALLAYLHEVAGDEPLDASKPPAGLHPLLIPLSMEKGGAGVKGLLRYPTPPEDMPMPVVRMDLTRGKGLTLLAASPEELIHRELATRDSKGEALPEGVMAELAADGGTPIYEAGRLASLKLPLKVYLLTKVGGFPELYEELVASHMARGDLDSALVTVDRLVGRFKGWAHPLAYRARLMKELGREPEARDSARAALMLPLWTLGSESFEELATMAGWKEVSSAPFRRLVENKEKPPLDRAAHLMDATFAEGADWDASRAGLVELYKEGELEPLVKFVGYPLS
eukprot:tig00000325_g24088.t1